MSDPIASDTLASAGAAADLPLLEVAGLTVLLEVNGARRAVLRDVSLTLRPGEAVGLVGESGSGKSMTARAIGRLLPRGAEVHGSIRFGGTEIGQLAGADLRRYRSQVAMIFQDPRAHINPVRRIGDFMTEALRTNHEVPAGAGAPPRGGHARPGGHRGRDPAAPAVPAPDVRRDAAAGHDRRGPAHRAPPAAGRRADHRAGRHHPGRGHGDTRRPAARAPGWRCCSSPTTWSWPPPSATARRSCTPGRSSKSAPPRCCTATRCTPTPPRWPRPARTSPRPRAGCAPSPAARYRAFEAPPGECAFAPRCPYAGDVCRAAGPGLVELDGGVSRCARAHELRGQLQAAPDG